MRKILSSIWQWGKIHKFHFFILTLFGLSGAVIGSQQIMIAHLNEKMNENKIRADEHISSVQEKLDARMDSLDNTVNLDAKRRDLVMRIRTAISEDSGRNIGVRDLNRMANAIIDASYQYNFTVLQVMAQVKVESNFDPTIISGAGARGLMQIMPGTWKSIQRDITDSPSMVDPLNIYNNVRGGCFYMSEQMRDFGTYEQALMAYNWGPDNLRRYNAGEIKEMPKETREYVPKVLEKIEFYKKYGLH